MTTTGTVSLDRRSWLGYRWHQHGLGEDGAGGRLDDLLLLGMQGSRQSAGEHPLSQRTTRIGNTPLPDAIRPDGPLVSLWSVRGAPHAHRTTQLGILRDALAPRDTDEGGGAFVEAVQEVAAALGQVVTAPTPKGDASAEVAGKVSPSLVQWCDRCKADHVPDDIFRAAGRQGLVVIGSTDQGTTMLHPPPQAVQDTVEQPRLALLQAFFRVNGPASRALFRDWAASSTQSTRELWDELVNDLVTVTVDNKRCELPGALVDAVEHAPTADGVALVPPHDPYLRQVDRTLLVPDTGRRRAVYRALSGPGALLVDGEVAGTWRYRRSEHQLTVEPFGEVTPTQKRAAEQRAASLAASTGDDAPGVDWH